MPMIRIIFLISWTLSRSTGRISTWGLIRPGPSKSNSLLRQMLSRMNRPRLMRKILSARQGIYGNWEDIEGWMEGKKADMFFTAPPYNALRSWNKDEAKSKTRLNPNRWFKNDNMTWNEYRLFLQKSFAHLLGHSIYVCCVNRKNRL